MWAIQESAGVSMLEQYLPQEPGREQPNDPHRQDASSALYAPPSGQFGQPGQFGQTTQPGRFGQQRWQMPPESAYMQAPMSPQAPAQGPYTGAALPQSYPASGYGVQQPYGMPPAPQQPRKRSGALIGIILLVVILGGGAAFALSHTGGTGGTGGTHSTSSTSTTTQQTGGATTIYSNALTGDVTGWLTTDGCSPESDGFHVTADISCFAPTDTLSDFSMTVTAQAVGADTSKPYGVTFRSAEAANEQIGNTYVLLIANDGSWTLAKIVDGNVTTLDGGSSSANTAIHTDGRANVIRVTMRGTHMTASVNGTQIASVDDSDIASGLVGIQGYDGGEAVFTNLTITK